MFKLIPDAKEWFNTEQYETLRVLLDEGMTPEELDQYPENIKSLVYAYLCGLASGVAYNKPLKF